MAAAAAVVAATFAAYLPSLSGELIWNDADYVTSPGLRSVGGLWRIWSQIGATQQYYPLLHSFFWAQHRLWGDAPLGYHLVTVSLHAASAVLLALVLRRLLAGSGAPASIAGSEWLAALLFALHPVHVESVAWISEQKNTLSLALYLAAALAYLAYDRSRASSTYWTAFAIFVLSLLCKTVTASLPAALLVAFWWKRGRIGWKQDIRPLAPWFAIGIAAGLFTSWVERTFVGAQGGDFAVSALGRVLVAGRAIWWYGSTLAWPFGLNFIYPKWAIDPSQGVQWLFPAGAAALAAVLWGLRGRARAPLAAYVFFVGSLFPALGFVNLYGARYSWVWDHWQYLPDIGPIALAAAGLFLFWRWLPEAVRWLAPAGTLVLVLALGSLTWDHCAMFHDNETLYLQTLDRNPGSWMAHNNLGLAWSKLPGRSDDAIAQYQEAIRLKPDVAETHTNLGKLWAAMPGRLDAAITEFREALRIDPGYSDAHFYLGNALAQKGDLAGSVPEYEAALKADPSLAEASNNLGIVLCRLGRIPEGLVRIEAALRIQPDFAQAHFSRGAALLQLGRRQEAASEFERVLALRPGFAPAEQMLRLAKGAP
ncbi:MAG TPA: tetratricopeptide repeat protein [Opitutaceae bacterium]|jgi:tetratricopeptide (TPR) repeat protein